MLKIYSPSGSEKQLADFLLENMSARGFKARKDSVGNVIGELGNDGPRILLCGHMDTVPGEIPVRNEGDILYGRGSVDAKSSLAAMIAGSSLAMERSFTPLQVTFATSGGHSASPWISKNSYEEAFMFWKAFKESLIDNDSPSKFSTVTGCVTTAVAGDSTSNIPSQARLIIDIRIPPSIKTVDMIYRVEEFTRHYQQNLEGVQVRIKVNDQTEA